MCVCVCPSTDGSSAANTNTGLSFKALLQAIDVLKREVQRQREEKELLEANVREQVVCEMMEVINEMQDGFRCVCQASVIYILAFVTGSRHSVEPLLSKGSDLFLLIPVNFSSGEETCRFCKLNIVCTVGHMSNTEEAVSEQKYEPRFLPHQGFYLSFFFNFLVFVDVLSIVN